MALTSLEMTGKRRVQDKIFCLGGNLDEFSAFPFENKLQKMKNLLRKRGKPLQQIVRRLQEIDRAKSNKKRISGNYSSSTGLYELEGIHYSGPVLLPKFAGAEQYKSLRFKNGVLSTSLSESCVFLENKDVFMIENFVKHH